MLETDYVNDIDSASIESFQSVEYKELIDKISRIIKLNKVSNILLWGILLIAQPGFFIFPIVGIILKVILRTKGKIDLQYIIEDGLEDEYKKKLGIWLSLNNCDSMWQIVQEASVSNTKVNAGASRNINRKLFKFTKKTPFYISTNIEIIQVILKKEKLIFLPDKILIIRGSKVGAINYDSIFIDIYNVRFIESERVPKDAKIIDYTWQFVNKNGTLDRRFKNNRQLPICLYSDIRITSPEGLNVEIQCFNLEIAKKFEEVIAN